MTGHIFNAAQLDTWARDEPNFWATPKNRMPSPKAAKSVALMFAIVVGLIIQTLDKAKTPISTDPTNAVHAALALPLSETGAYND